jgi:hypothetical protein
MNTDNFLERCPHPITIDTLMELRLLYEERFEDFLRDDDRLKVQALLGDDAAYLLIEVGAEARRCFFEFFCEARDGVLREYFEADRDAYLPLDFSPFTFEDNTIYARSELRNLNAESAAQDLLQHNNN